MGLGWEGGGRTRGRDCFIEGTKELRTQNPVIAVVLVLEAMALTFLAKTSDSPGNCALPKTF